MTAPPAGRARRDDPEVSIRLAEPGELEVLRDIERRAGRAFADVGMPEIAEDEPMPIAEHEAHRVAGRLWVVVGSDDQPLGFVATSIVDGACHIDEVTVDPDEQGRGLGRRLLDHVTDHARDAGLSAVTLTTFTDVPWNRPLYEHCGFRVLAPAETGPGLLELRAQEAAHGLDPDLRVCMRRKV